MELIRFTIQIKHAAVGIVVIVDRLSWIGSVNVGKAIIIGLVFINPRPAASNRNVAHFADIADPIVFIQLSIVAQRPGNFTWNGLSSN